MWSFILWFFNKKKLKFPIRTRNILHHFMSIRNLFCKLHTMHGNITLNGKRQTYFIKVISSFSTFFCDSLRDQYFLLESRVRDTEFRIVSKIIAKIKPFIKSSMRKKNKFNKRKLVSSITNHKLSETKLILSFVSFFVHLF